MNTLPRELSGAKDAHVYDIYVYDVHVYDVYVYIRIGQLYKNIL